MNEETGWALLRHWVELHPWTATACVPCPTSLQQSGRESRILDVTGILGIFGLIS